MSPTRRSLLAAGLLAGLAGCAPETVASPSPTTAPPDPTTPAPAPTPSPSPSPSPTPVPRAPLTGLPVSDPTVLARPAVAVKVPNLKAEQPQWGLDVADVVFCQPNGEGSTRLCPVFHSDYPEAVGPVRSIRPADVPLLSPIFPLLANTGAAEWVMNYLEAHAERIEKMTYLDFKKTEAFSVDQDRLYRANGRTQYDRAIQAHPAGMAALAERAGAPGAYLSFAADAASASTATGAAATSVAIPYASGHKADMSYDFDETTGRYLRSQPWGEHLLADDTRVDADNVLIVRVKWEYDKIWRGSGAADPVLDLIDTDGDFSCLNGGRIVEGTWSKGAIDEPFTFLTADGAPLLLAPGRTWIELPRPTADVVVA